jgi:hypothetical protein
MKTSIYSVLSLLGVLTVEIDADHRSLLRGFTSISTSSTSTDSVAFRRGLQDSTTPKQCPKPDTVEFCTKYHPKELAPVSCDDCTYDNICIAEAAGFLENECELVVQEVAVACNIARLSCEDDIGPVICDDSCEYSFLCIAIVSGYTEDQCVPVEGKVIPVNASGTFECPAERDPDIVCSAVFAPVVCDDCVYENICVASSVGYAIDDCEPQVEPAADPNAIPIDPREPQEEPADLNAIPIDPREPQEEPAADPNAIPIDPREPCPETGLVFCNKMYDPVICKDVCTYGNLCLGLGAGFLKSDCLPDAR